MVTILRGQSLADLDEEFQDQLAEIDRQPEPLSLSGASAGDLGSDRSTWPGPNMLNPRTGRPYPEREMWRTAEALVEAAINQLAA